MNKGLRVAILVTAAAGLIILVLDVLALTVPAFTSIFVPAQCGDVCGIQWLILGLLIALIGMGLVIAAVVLACIDAGRRGDWLSVGLILLQLVLSTGAVIYLVAAVNATSGPNGPVAGAPSSSLVVTIGSLCVLALPVSLLLYGLLSNRGGARRITLATLAVLVVLAPLVVAPPWVAFTALSSVPVLSVNAPTNTPAACPDGPFPPFTIVNTGGGTLQWSAALVGKPTIVPVTISPSSGTLDPAQSQTVVIMPPGPSATGSYQAVSITISSNGGEGSVSYPCSG
jgi:hypothetical protein